MDISPEYYGLSSRVKLEDVSANHIGIVKRIKSRIIQKDALKIVEIAAKIRDKETKYKVSLICNENICSKSIKLLLDNGIGVIH